jgi:hypothetical protein
LIIQGARKNTDEKENQIFLKYKEIQNRAVANSYMRKGFLIYEEMRKYLAIYGGIAYRHTGNRTTGGKNVK